MFALGEHAIGEFVDWQWQFRYPLVSRPTASTQTYFTNRPALIETEDDMPESWSLFYGDDRTWTGGGGSVSQEIYVNQVRSDPDGLMDYHQDSGYYYLFFLGDAWYDWRAKIAIDVNGGLAASGNGSLVIRASINGTGAAASYVAFWETGDFASQTIEISGADYFSGVDGDFGNSVDLYADINAADDVILTCTEFFIIRKNGGVAP